jgi:ketosteroid isomerase-like protein
VISDPLSIVDAYFAAETARDYEAMRGLLADEGFHFRSPIASFDRANDFVRHAAVSGGIIIDKQVRKVFVDGADVCHILTYRIQISEKQSVEVVHWSQVREGRIRRIEAVFDASAYRELFPSEGADR